MPSLQDLREFKASFDEIGNEKAALEAQNLPYEDLSLPEIEAEEPGAEEAADIDTSRTDPDLSAVPDQPETETGGAEAPSGQANPALGDFDMDALLGAVPPELPDIPDEFPGIPAGNEPEDSGIPGDLLNGLADDVDQAPAGAEIPDLGEGVELGDTEEPGPDAETEIPDLGEGVEPGDTEEPGPDAETEIPDLGEGVELGDTEEPGPDAETEIPDLGEGVELGDTEEPGPDAGSKMPDLDLDLDLDLDSGTGEAQETKTGDQGIETGEDDLDLSEGFGEADLRENADSFDSFDMERKPPSPEGEDETGMDLGDFTLPGIDDVLDDIPGQSPPQETGKKKDRAAGPPPGEKEPEAIQLTEDDLAQFQRTLTGYPLNLRVAVEEIIAEHTISPAQMEDLVRLLVRGAPPKETAALAGKILDRTIKIPVQKKTGEQMEAERGSFAYIFVHRFLPVIRLTLFILVVAASSCFLIWRFIYTPIHAENIYRLGYDRIGAGEYERANQRFTQAFNIHRDKNWFYKYAEAFRDQRQYIYAEEKYDELLSYYPRDKKGVLDYAALETYYRRNYEKADRLLRYNILDYNPDDSEALLAQGDNALAWGEVDSARYEDARFAYARLLELYGWTDPVAERMLRYFIRTDNLKEVIPLQSFFMDNPKKKIRAETLAELGGYLLDKRTEEVRGVPNAYAEQISGVRDVLLRAVLQGPALPEAHYHLSRYYRYLGNNLQDEELTLRVALRNFENTAEESVRRLAYHIEALEREAEILRNRREYFASEERLVKAIGLYEDGLDRRLLRPAPEFGRLYASMGDLEYFTKSGDMEMALSYYLNAEKTGYSSPEMLYYMGSAYYHQKNWAGALERFFTTSAQLPLDRRILLALGNTCYQRGDYFAAQGYYNRLLDLLEAERARLPILLPNDEPGYIETAERLMIARNNMGVTLEALSRNRPAYRAQALGLYAQAIQAWDALTRNPQSMIRLGAGDFSNPGANLPYLNSRNLLYPQAGYEAQIFPSIDKDILEPSPWEL
ncbi:MAG: tetratricopeptide repeat protein [Treponema sp.]|jgi:Flp pilus assembly protein TadD|nr:tetratricopeptide repeat protein [Treponema sp.]